ncbi:MULTISPECIES: BRO-N domain-containing protein [Vibrio]|uniref:BRO-N domain-containing protein n=1 Tax=Vibrio TaxID=662 RepID=UPI0015597759|nr:BRO family protein [Vibrio vulnificus]HDY8183125.1 hypothetical protein [Vibrio vulnificus]
MVEKKHQLLYPSSTGEVPIRTLDRNGKILFCFPDVVKVLAKDNQNYSNKVGEKIGFAGLLSKLSSVLKPKHQVIIPLSGTNEFGAEFDYFVTEAGLYKLLTFDDSPGAERFQDWVFEEVLPSIRKYKMYPPPKEGASEMSTMVALLKQNVALLAEEIEKRELLESKVQTIDERVTAIETEASNSDLVSISWVLNSKSLAVSDDQLYVLWCWCEKIKLQSGAESIKSTACKSKYKYPQFVVEQAINEILSYDALA